jgi:hypothetical protein
MTAEITNARPRIWTQMRQKNQGGALDPQALFFDSESRGVQASHDNEDNSRQVDQLAFMQQMTRLVNKLQTTNPADGASYQPNSFTSGGGVAAGKHSHVPPEVPPAIFTLPKEQEVANTAGQLPQARGDLEALSRLAIEQFGAAFGAVTAQSNRPARPRPRARSSRPARPRPHPPCRQACRAISCSRASSPPKAPRS